MKIPFNRFLKNLEFSQAQNSSVNPVLFTVFVLVAMISRFALPPFMGHPENFSPIDATAMFSGAYLGRKWIAFLLPLLSVWISDLAVNYQYFHKIVLFYPGFYWQYGFYLLVVVFSSYFLGKNKGLRVPLMAILVSMAFFVISNFGVWVNYPTYPHTIQGLMLCYTAGIPFYRSTLLSDVLYSLALFGAFEFVKSFSFSTRIKPTSSKIG